jgi:hypothetical protein
MARTNAQCPVATSNVVLNLRNRQHARENAGYGPANPGLPNTNFWRALANLWGTSVAEAKTMRCGNCAAFNISPGMLKCIKQGLGPEGDPEATIDAGQLGYCQMFHFKCASARTCSAWVFGGPIR